MKTPIPIFICLLAILPCQEQAVASEPKEKAFEPYATVTNDLLSQYEQDYENFRGIQIADKIVYFQQRKIAEAIVQRDYVLYHFDKDSKELVDVRVGWREDLPDVLPAVDKSHPAAIDIIRLSHSEKNFKNSENPA